jgi:ribosomal protein L11 methyltransferase
MGISEELGFVQTRENFVPVEVKKDLRNLVVYFGNRPQDDFLLAIQSEFPNVKVELTEQTERDWLEEWKKGYEPLCLVDGYWVVPSWLPTPTAAVHAIIMEPGMAFGTGTHPTTQVVAELMFEYTKMNRSQKSLIDVGTGTGILAILGRQMGFESVVGIDNDEEALRVARENIEKNQIENIDIRTGLLESIAEQFDMVVANIIDGVLLKLRLDLVRVMKSGGVMVLSGILKDHEDEFIAEFVQPSKLKVLDRKVKGDWVGLLLSL